MQFALRTCHRCEVIDPMQPQDYARAQSPERAVIVGFFALRLLHASFDWSKICLLSKKNPSKNCKLTLRDVRSTDVDRSTALTSYPAAPEQRGNNFELTATCIRLGTAAYCSGMNIRASKSV
ncbi:hypothetical protein F441_16985 [Phytophthora nicotianae CJ01A1]|uniref:Uncharacterized protein n=4 Tax=Phytophthora nicotianae TaxID=4792 RepID=W2YIM2_PHYNI|nr:hypothetical protein L915_16653 [Phytophthora nicotianae]ETO65554.1 hypothetical protein F444_17157 [Phytophthora nicotianae P1976]ETP06723.1 hypothetical protein F441_16985 [Phytophthora nicotianae CJ01A1]ETP34761.1 hypothetical protein F442_16984 [Phytophthora nicotianae P10297]ETL30479.1 hypothetical protein L916_16558 [Phytophthora nicotianae]